ncbi:MAG: HEAT repeat domain-containing protein [Myxococcales bacterium]|nr:HEAT repeat domain-containing protein [Myxococcales bacterium]
MTSWTGTSKIAGLLLAALLASPGQASPADDAEALVRKPWIEGIPHEVGAALPLEACPRLLELLADPAESAAHANVVLALGMAECPGAYAALADLSRTTGPVDRETYRALRTIPHAMGFLAAQDSRALVWLDARSRGASAPAWSFRNHQGPALADAERRRAATGLAFSGRPEALRTLEDLAASPDPGVRAAASDALGLADRIRAEGAREVLDAPEARGVVR